MCNVRLEFGSPENRKFENKYKHLCVRVCQLENMWITCQLFADTAAVTKSQTTGARCQAERGSGSPPMARKWVAGWQVQHPPSSDTCHVPRRPDRCHHSDHSLWATCGAPRMLQHYIQQELALLHIQLSEAEAQSSGENRRWIGFRCGFGLGFRSR